MMENVAYRRAFDDRVVCVALILVLCLMNAFFPGKAIADDKSPKGEGEGRIAYLEAARIAILEGDTARAAKVLSEAARCWKKEREKCGFLREDYLNLTGVLYMEHGRYREAAENFRQVLLKQPERKAVWLYYGRALYELKLYERAAGALKKAQGVRDDTPHYWVLRARAEVNAGRPDDALRVLGSGLESLPQSREIHAELVNLYLQAGLFFTARDMAARFVETGGDASGYLQIADTLFARGRYHAAVRALEEARMIQPGDPEIIERLAHAYARSGRYLAAGRLYEKVAFKTPDGAYAAAEAYRASKRYRDALRMNRLVADERKMLVQRLNIYLSAGFYPRAVQLRRPLIRVDALNDEIIFRLAYASIRGGRFSLASRLLREIRGGRYRAQAEEMVELIKPCKESPWLCR